MAVMQDVTDRESARSRRGATFFFTLGSTR
jgi:hypothetical protein